MAETVYSYRVRTIECDNCRAPLTSTALEGGQLTCTFCGASLQIAGRRREHREETRISEPERLAGLRAQKAVFDSEKALLQDPEVLRPFRSMLKNPDTRAAGLEGLRQEWEKTRRAVASGGSADGETHLLRVAIIVALTFREAGDHTRARAILETALELLSDGEHRDIVRCRLVQAAVRAGDLEAAASWLEEVNPRPIKLEADHEVRVARATLQLACGEHRQLLETLGRKPGDVPLLHLLRPYCLRAHAHAGLGDPEAARREIWIATSSWNSAAVAEEWQACPGPSTAMVPEATAKHRRGIAFSTITFGAIVAASCFGTCMTPFCISTVTCGDEGLYNLAMHRLRECPAAKEALGEPIEWAVGPSYCEGEGSGGCKDGCGLPWKMRVKGSKARGRIRVEASRWQGKITLITGDLHLDGRTINFKDCR
jgi:predicted nucleic acid-binding protein